jgi:hypothetical protein
MDETEGPLALLEEKINTWKILVGKLERKNNLKDLDVDEKIILKGIFSTIGR